MKKIHNPEYITLCKIAVEGGKQILEKYLTLGNCF